MPLPPPVLDVRRAADRFRTRSPGVRSAHSFSFGRHYDSANTSHGLLLAHNDIEVDPGAGFDSHPHRDMEIVTWVLQGSLLHEDSTGHSTVITPGLVQRMSAGSGIQHAETHAAQGRPAAGSGPVRFVQMWVAPDVRGSEPGYAQQEVGDQLAGSALVPVASGLPRHAHAAIALGSRAAALHAARLQPGRSVELPDAPYVHLFLAQGEADLEGAGHLDEGDAVRVTGTGGQRVTAARASELLVWEMHAALDA